MNDRSEKLTIRMRVALAVLTLAFLVLFNANIASAAKVQQVGTFAGGTGPSFPEQVQLGGVGGGMAVNSSGAGGVPAGTLYAATKSHRLQMYVPGPEGKMEFSESWAVNSSEGPYQRCGPLLGTEEVAPGETVATTPCAAQPSEGPGEMDVEVNQATGNVYVYGKFDGVEGNQIVVYTANGASVLTRFGELTLSGTVAASPAKLHGFGSQVGFGSLAVNSAGVVYVRDVGRGAERYSRLMVFAPSSPGNFEHYVYKGETVAAPNLTTVPGEPVTDAAGNIYVVEEEGDGTIEEYASPTPAAFPAPAVSPVCRFVFNKGGITSMTVTPGGEVFFFSYKDKRMRRLGPCDPLAGKFAEATEPEQVTVMPERAELYALAYDPDRHYSPDRPSGVLYGAAPSAVPQNGNGSGEPGKGSLGYQFAPGPESPPAIGEESVSNVGATSARVRGTIDPRGFQTRYTVQYLADGAYQANEPDEIQSLTVSASGGLFGLGFEGKRLGGPALATLSAGSTTVSALETASATATLKAATGTGKLNGARGKGTLISGSSTVSSLATESSNFEVGQGISGVGIPAGARITAVAPEGSLQRLTISKAASISGIEISLTSGTKQITALTTAEGAFEVGQTITGTGIAGKTKITAVGAGELTLSAPVDGPANGVTLKAGSTQLTSVSPGVGSFEVGRPIQGEGIAAGATVSAVSPGLIEISAPVEKPGTGVTVTDPGPYPLAVGERLEGPGIAPGTTITAIGAGQLTLSDPATASGTGVSLVAGLPADVKPGALRYGLEGLATIGAGAVQVSGGPGDESGASPYRIRFTGPFENTDVPQLGADDLTLSGGAATVTVATQHDGGGGFAAGAKEAPAGGALLPSVGAAQTVGVTLGGLSPETTYRYRILATSHCSTSDEEKVCEVDGAAQRFDTHPSTAAGLPDGRAYELVSPPEKHGGQVFPADPRPSSCPMGAECKPGGTSPRFPIRSSPDGEALVYEGTPFGPLEGAANENEYIAHRTDGGWSSTNLTPSLLRNSKGSLGFQGFATDLGVGVLKQAGPALSPNAPGDFQNLYEQPSGSPEVLQPFLTEAPPNRTASGNGEFQVKYVGGSANGALIFLEANDALTEATPTAPKAVDGGVSKFNLYEWEWETGQLRLVNVEPGNVEAAPGARFGLASANGISANGDRAFWSDSTGQVYVRENAEVTRELKDGGEFLSAATDGSRVLLTDGCLYLLADDSCVDLTENGNGVHQGGFIGLVGQSDDLSHLYFVDSGALSPIAEENENGEHAEAGKNNLYSWSGGPATFIAQLPEEPPTGVKSDSWNPAPSSRTAQASPSGRWVAFMSRGTLTGYDNRGPCPVSPLQVSGPCLEVFLYDSAANRLLCPSCNPSGSRPLGYSLVLAPFGGPSTPQPRYLSNSGRLFFDSQDSLSQLDTNEGVEDVYEWEPPHGPEQAAGNTCNRPSGCLSLISLGRGAVDSNFLAADESGANVFFTTRDRLLPQDGDELLDVYDAREGGGFAEPSPARPGGSNLQVVPVEPTPTSTTVAPEGNVKQTCKKSQVKKKGKCVSKPKHRKKRHHRAKQPRKTAREIGGKE